MLINFFRWRNRRASVKELRSRDEEVRQEYLKMREWDRQEEVRKNATTGIETSSRPPNYGEVIRSSGESVAGMSSNTRDRQTLIRSGGSSISGSTR